MQQPEQKVRRFSPRVLVLGGVVLAFLLLILLPPYLNVSRFQRRIAANIGDSLGRTVHLDRVALTLLPVPGFTLENFVVDEDPAFGFEPVIRADSVHVNVRLRSLWRRRVEFSRISLTDPHVNLVRLEDGRWNLESILLRASKIDSAPTTQRFVSAAPRFPYVEATGARINLKLGQVKMPLSLTEADFALWLPEPKQWQLRLEAHPSRTDAASPEGQLATGTLRVEGTLGSAASLAEVPIDLHATWQKAQMGGASRLLSGQDAGLRGNLSLTVAARGTVGDATVTSILQIANARRADFVPPNLLSIEIGCQANALETFHRAADIECHTPPASSGEHSDLILTGDLPDILSPDRRGSHLHLTVPALPTAKLLGWIAIASPRPPESILASGTLAGDLSYNGAGEPDGIGGPPVATEPHFKAHASLPVESEETALPGWSGDLTLSGETLQGADQASQGIPVGDVTLHLAQFPAHSGPELLLLPLTIPLGGPGVATLEGHFDRIGYTLRLTGNAVLDRLLAFSAHIPQFGDGLRAALHPETPTPEIPAARQEDAHSADVPVPLDLTATRVWGEAQTWTSATPEPITRTRRGKRTLKQ